MLISSPLGTLVSIADEDSIVGLYFSAEHKRHPREDLGVPDEHLDIFLQTRLQLEEYFAGKRRVFDVPVVLRGTAFQQEVWRALRRIPYGNTTSYGALANTMGRPGAARAVGAANGANPVSIIVPCHRVIGVGGSLIGYGGGLKRKRALLALEGAIIPARPVEKACS